MKTGTTLAELMCRPELSYHILAEIDSEREKSLPLSEDIVEQVEIEIKYEGYIARQLRQVEQYKKMEKKKFLKISIIMIYPVLDWKRDKS